ncbi:MAG: ParB/RepB/Spo0J family partition protein [Candidatus Paceibacterota bacterium]|jgi:ParB/RepB/Spo0J family partition protein
MSLLADKEWVKRFNSTIKTLPAEGVMMEVPMSIITRDDSFNARLTANLSASKDELASHKAMGATTQHGATQITELAAQIARDGLLTPLTCRPDPAAPGKLSLVAGFRRHAALQLNKAENARVLIKDMSEVQARIINMAENVSRRDLKPYEVAIRMKLMRDDFGMQLKAVGTQLGFTGGYTTFLTTILDKGHPRLIRLWGEGRFQGVLTVDNLYRWASKLDSEEQIKEFELARVSKGFDEEGNEIELAEGEEKEKKGKDTGPKKPGEAIIAACLNRALAGGIKTVSKDRLEGAIAALRFVAGEVATLDGWYDPAAEKEALEKQEKVVKAKAKAAKAAAEAQKLESELGSN